MTRHRIDPKRHVRGQIRHLGIREPLPFPQTLLYRFYDADGCLLYVGVTRRPYERWQAHKKSAPWWSDVAALSFDSYPHEREALDAEVVAIRSELPLHNKRSAHAPLTDSSCTPHEESQRISCAALPRVGGGVGVGGGLGVRASIQDQVDLLTVGARLWDWFLLCDGRHDLIFDGEPQAVEAWWRCPVCRAEV